LKEGSLLGSSDYVAGFGMLQHVSDDRGSVAKRLFNRPPQHESLDTYHSVNHQACDSHGIRQNTPQEQCGAKPVRDGIS
jgi:hypothetical protein